MTKNVSTSKHVNGLRNWAEERIPEPVDSIDWISGIEAKKLVHELEVHQIELEMQNEALQNSQAETADEHRKYADLYDFAPVGYFTLDRKGRIIEANVTGASLLGSEKRSLTGQPFHRFIHTGYFSIFQFHLQKALDKPCKQTYKLKLVKKDGSSFDAQIDTITVTDGEGKFDQYRSSVIDITEQNLMEEKAKESEKKFFSVFHSAPVSMSISTLHEGRFLDVNEEFLHTSGHSREEMIGQTSIDLNIWVDPERRKEFIETIQQKGRLRGYDARIRTKSGEFRDMLWSAELVSLNNIPCLIVSAVDITERKQLEKMLIKSEQQYRTMVENLPIGVYQVGIDGKFIFANQEFVRIMDCDSIEELMNSNVVHLYKNPKDRLVFLYTIRESGIIRNYEIEILTKRGVSKNILINGFIEGDHISGTVVDIVERKRAEEALRESEERYRHLVQHAPAGIYEVDLTARKFLNVNDVMCQYTGYTSEEFLSLDPIQLLAEESAEAFIQQHAKVLAGEPLPGNIEFKIKRKDSSEFWVILNTHYSYEPNNRIIATVIAHDITERKSMEDALRKSEEHYRSLVESTKDSIYLLDRDLRYLFANSAYLSRLGFTLQQLIGQSYSELHPLSNDAFPEYVNHVFKTGECAEFEYESIRDKKPFLRTLGPVKGVHGETIAVTVISKNVSTLKNAEKALRSYQDQLRGLLGRVQAAREEERAMIAREIHDEMGGALTGLKLDLSYMVNSAPKYRDKTKRDSFLKQVDNMTRLIEETIGKVRRIITDLRPSILDDFGLLAAIEWQIKDFEKRTGIQCEFISAMENISLDKDRCTAVFRIFQESLTNVVRHASATKVAVRFYEEKDSLILKVEDNGKGISKLLIHDKTSFGLLGMRERALFLGGIVNISGEPWKGTTLSVEIPLGLE